MLGLLAHVPFTSAWTEVIGCLGLLGAVGGLYRHVECNQAGCHRLGRFRHGHLKLCHRHHPAVPDDGRITAEHIASVAVPPSTS